MVCQELNQVIFRLAYGMLAVISVILMMIDKASQVIVWKIIDSGGRRMEQMNSPRPPIMEIGRRGATRRLAMGEMRES